MVAPGEADCRAALDCLRSQPASYHLTLAIGRGETRDRRAVPASSD
jgi:hypothetical protein